MTRSYNPTDHLEFLLSVIYDKDPLTREHLADIKKSGLTDETIAMQKLRSVPPHMIPQLASEAVGHDTLRPVGALGALGADTSPTTTNRAPGVGSLVHRTASPRM